MNWLGTGSCEATTDFGWIVGTLCGLTIDSAVVLAILQTPRLREHGGTPPPIGRLQGWAQRVPGFLAAIVWFCGLYRVGVGFDLLACYARNSALAASVVIGFIMVVLFPLAATQIARRSVW